MSLLIPEPLLGPCHHFLELLDHWNRTHALTALPLEDRFEELIMDSFVLVPFLEACPPGSRIVDFGSGMGIPAVVLALSRPDVEILALDKSRKKMAFVRQVALELKLGSLKCLTGRAEDLPCLNADAGVAKAVGSPDLLAGWWKRHGKPGAPFYALKGESWKQEPEPGRGWALRPYPYQLPTRGARTLLELKRTDP